jgi:hypothetical protein
MKAEQFPPVQAQSGMVFSLHDRELSEAVFAVPRRLSEMTGPMSVKDSIMHQLPKESS